MVLALRRFGQLNDEAYFSSYLDVDRRYLHGEYALLNILWFSLMFLYHGSLYLDFMGFVLLQYLLLDLVVSWKQALN